MQSESERDKRTAPPRYSGEDTRLTSKKELSGWYSYGFAAEVFVVCGIGMLARNARNTQNTGLITSDRIFHTYNPRTVSERARRPPLGQISTLSARYQTTRCHQQYSSGS